MDENNELKREGYVLAWPLRLNVNGVSLFSIIACKTNEEEKEARDIFKFYSEIDTRKKDGLNRFLTYVRESSFGNNVFRDFYKGIKVRKLREFCKNQNSLTRSLKHSL